MDEQLCSECKKLNIAQYFQQEIHVQKEESGFVRPSEQAIRLKSLSEIYNTADSCDFCRVVLGALCKRWNPERWPSLDEYWNYITSYVKDPAIYLYSYLYAEDDHFKDSNSPSGDDREGSTVRRCYRLGVGLRAPTDRSIPFIDHAGVIQLVATSCGLIGTHPNFCGRIINPSRADLALAKLWLQECNHVHGRLCESPSWDDGSDILIRPSVSDLRVIDVERMCLVSIPEGSRYVTLSYRWAVSTPYLTTTTSNIADLQIDNSLTRQFQSLPPTIRDTIDCVRELGETFLWVDALCIIQDSPEDKEKLIRQMDQIYMNSLVTIISATSNGPHLLETSGLPGYRTRDKMFLQDTARVQGLDICTTYTDVDITIMETSWRHRAWTFQEESLPRRRLYFTASQLYFQCTCGVFCEDAVGEGKSPSACFYWNSNLLNVDGLYGQRIITSEGSARALFCGKFQNAGDAVDYYQSLVEGYTLRNMTDQSDALAALKGVLSVLTEAMGTQFVYGIPESYFNEAILWISQVPLRRRRAASNRIYKEPFPTWTWAGWENFSNYRGAFTGCIWPEVDWFLVTKAGNIARLAPRGSPTTFNGSGHKNVRPTATIPDPFTRDLKECGQLNLDELESSVLVCWSSIACFQLMGDTLSMDEDWMSSAPEYETFIISDSHSRPVGSIHMEKQWSDTVKDQTKFEFMLLSRSNTIGSIWIVNMDEAAFPVEEWCFINVMLVKRQDNVVERLGVGVVHENAWVAANPSSMLLYVK